MPSSVFAFSDMSLEADGDATYHDFGYVAEPQPVWYVCNDIDALNRPTSVSAIFHRT
jgi:hypothetical protein